MDFLQHLSDIVFYDTAVVSVPLFFISFILLIIGVGIKVWRETMHLTRLERKPLDWIERTHPHIPSLRTVITINLCVLSLCAVGLQSLHNAPPFNDPYEGLNLLTLFILAAALGTLGELHWKKSQTIAYGFILGTGFAYLSLALLVSTSPMPMFSRMLLGIASLLTAVITGFTLRKDTHRWIAMSIALSVFVFWFLIYYIQ